VGAVIVQRHRLSGPGVNLSTAPFDLGVPRTGCIGIGLTIEATEKLQRQTGSFPGGEPEDLAQHIRSRHRLIVAEEVGPRGC
jgi:hypothetical protein